ncbi:MAG: hypothetical protein Q9M28_11940 [Mariprofundaceae bacterium]|nr:hypothetical protein [Mariprofundaceae bacterium]
MKKTIILAALLAITSVPSVFAADAHQHGGEHHNMQAKSQQSDMGQMTGMFLVKKDIDGFQVSFHAMKVKEGMQHGGTHNVMIKVEKDGHVLGDLSINSKVVHPNNKAESKMLMKMGDWYMAGYDLGHEGQHQLIILFKTSDGVKHSGGVYYPEKKSTHAHEQGVSHEH